MNLLYCQLVSREEIFGPVVAIIKFKSIDEAIEIANDLDCGLVGGVSTQNLDTALMVTSKIKTGPMWVNCFVVFNQSTPFGGYKQSGLVGNFASMLSKSTLKSKLSRSFYLPRSK